MKIECRNVSYLYDVPGDGWALTDIGLTITQGEKIAVVGPAGSGKTTLIQLLDALILPTKGDVLYDGMSVRVLSRSKRLPSIRRRIGVLFQFPEHQFFHESAYEELTFAMRNLVSAGSTEIDARARSMTDRFQLDMDALKGMSPFNLSSGEKRKLALASALMTSPEVLILDEPTAGMDALGRKELIHIISTLKDTTVILVTHNQEDFLGIVDRVIGISKGAMVIDASRDVLIDHLATMNEAGITPPLVLTVQHWLKACGCGLDRKFFDMKDLIGYLSAQARRT